MWSDHFPGGRLEDRRSCCLIGGMTPPGLSETTPKIPMPVRRSQIVVRDAQLMGHRRAGDGPERVEARCPGATSRDEEIARRAFCAGFPVPRWCASVRLTMSSNRSRARVALCAVASSGLKPSRAFSNRLRPKPTVPVRVLLAVPVRATSSKHDPRGSEADVGSGDESPRRWMIITPMRVCLSSHALCRCSRPQRALASRSQSQCLGRRRSV